MALTNFIPTIWAANILANLNIDHVYAQPGVVNREYEGLISGFGDTVKINSMGRVTTFDYTKNVDMPAPEVLTATQRELRITEARAFNFYIDDIDKAQAQPALMGPATSEAAYALSADVDAFVGALYVDGTAPLGSAAAPIVLSPADAYDLLVDLDIKLKNQRITGPRTAVVPTWFYGLVRKDPRFITAEGSTLLQNGYVGRVASVNVVESQNVPTLGTGAAKAWVLQVSTPAARSFAEQIVETEAYRPERRFGDALKGLHVYGGKVVRPEALVSAIVQPNGTAFRAGVVS